MPAQPVHRFAVVRSGAVENVMLAASAALFNTQPWKDIVAGAQVVPVDGVTVGPGWTYDGETFSAPEPVE